LDRLSVTTIVCVSLLAVAACGSGGGKETPMRFVDSVRVRHVQLPAAGALKRCLALTSFRRGAVVVVERRGRATRSLTIAQRGSIDIFACDATGVPLEGREWCGVSAGRLRNGRVTDPRLELLCRDRRGRHVATAFVNPGRGTHWVAVERSRSTELYPAAAGLPIRIATIAGVDYEHARATFRIARLDARGRVLSRSRLVAHVAG
jgi:hypothetical protein